MVGDELGILINIYNSAVQLCWIPLNPKSQKAAILAIYCTATRRQVQVVWAEYISFYAIVTNYNGTLATAQARIHVAAHIKVAKLEAILALK